MRDGSSEKCTETAVARGGDRYDLPAFGRLSCQLGSETFWACIERIECCVFEHESQAIAGS